MKIIFDLDGTLIDSKKRLHELFCELVGSREISFNSYWDAKFKGKSNQDILKSEFNYKDVDVDIFVANWMKKIESSDYLAMDSPIEGLQKFLQEIGKDNQLYICTARQSVSQVTMQLKNLSVLKFFQDIFVTEQKFTKAALLIKSGMSFDKDDWFVGDTGHDINTGKKIGIKTCAVLSGFMPESAIRSYEPDLVLPDVTSFLPPYR
jgi:phosphoglycolate phosphatase